MSDYKNQRPSPSASASDPCVVYDNSVSFDKLINESQFVTTYKGVKLQSVPSLLEQINSEANAAVISLGWHQVGLFADGFTYTLQNDIAKDAAGDWYRWNGSLPKVVASGTLPSSDVNFVKIDYKSHAELSDRNPADGSAHNADDIGGLQVFIDQTESALTNVDGEIVLIENKIDRIENAPSFIPKGASKEDGRLSSIGSNYVSTMKTSDASSTFGTAGFNLAGEFVGDGSDNLAAWTLGAAAHSYTCQARMYWGAGINAPFIGYNTSATFGMTALESFIGLGFTSSGFVFNNRVAIQTLVLSSELTEGWYEVSLVYNTGSIFCSLCKSGETKAFAFALTQSLLQPRNAQIGTYSASDKIRDFRYCSTESGNTWTPPFGGGRAIQLPLVLPQTNPSGGLISVHLPAGYDPRITHRLAVYCHGAGGTNNDFWEYPRENSVLTALLNAGYVVMAANYSSEAWGNPASVVQNTAAIEYVKDRYNVFNAPFMIVQSMGGLVGLNTVLVGGVKPAAIAGIFPAVNLLWCYENGFTSRIETAFGFIGADNFETATAGYDTLNDNAPIAFNGLKMKIWHSPDDTVISKSQNTDLLKTKAEEGGGVVTVVSASGDHGDPSGVDGDGIVEFFSTI